MTVTVSYKHLDPKQSDDACYCPECKQNKPKKLFNQYNKSCNDCLAAKRERERIFIEREENPVHVSYRYCQE